MFGGHKSEREKEKLKKRGSPRNDGWRTHIIDMMMVSLIASRVKGHFDYMQELNCHG